MNASTRNPSSPSAHIQTMSSSAGRRTTASPVPRMFSQRYVATALEALERLLASESARLTEMVHWLAFEYWYSTR